MKSNRNRRFSIDFTGSYLILMIIPIIMGISAYHNSIQLACNNIIVSNEIALQQLGESIDNSMEAADQFALSLSSMHQNIRSFSSLSDQPNMQVCAVRSTIEELPIHIDSNGLTDNYYIVDYESDIIVSPGVGYLSSYDYYESKVKPKGISYSNWYDSVFSTKLTQIKTLSAENSSPLLLYAYPFSLFNISRASGSVVFTLDNDTLHDLAAPILDTDVAQICILSNTGDLLLNTGIHSIEINNKKSETIDLSHTNSFEQKINGERILVSVWKGDYFTLISAVPHNTIAHRASNVLHTVLLYLILYIFMHILLCIWMIRRNHPPVLRMLDHLEKWAGKRPFVNSLNNIENAVECLSKNAESLERSLQSQELLLRTAYVNRLISGDIIDESKIEEQLEQVGFSIEGEIMRGIYMHWKTTAPPTNELNYLCVQIIELLDNFAPELRFINLNSTHRFTLLYTALDSDTDNHKRLLQMIYSRLKLEMDVDVSFFVGHPCSQIKNVHESFSAASALMDSGLDENEKFLFEVENTSSSDGSHLPLMNTQKLANLLSAGNYSAIVSYMEEIQQEYLKSEKISEFERKLFYYRMVDILVSVNSDLPLSPELKYSISSLSQERFFFLILKHCENICLMNQEKKVRQVSDLVRGVTEYIDQNFTDPNISLYSVALEFNLTESYLSLLIKDKLGETFSSRIERLRIEKAIQLLHDTDLRIDAISEQIGYANANTFRRAFRRVHGFSPSDYRTETRS